jgi:hypothetical protein
VLVRAGLGVAVAAAVICANGAVRAGDDDEDGASVMNRILQSFGIKPAPDHSWDGINYSERSPLVVPPTRDLPPPVNGSVAPAANWPKDQDSDRRAKAKPDGPARYQKDNVLESQRPLRPDELGAPGSSRTSEQGSSGPSADAGYGDPRGTSVDQRDQGAKKSLFSLSSMFKKEDYATFTGEPSRETLTDPPPGYLTPSPDQPYGFGRNIQPYKVPTVGERMEPAR